MPAKTLRVLLCDYCEAEIPESDERDATWSSANPRPFLSSSERITDVLLCAECRGVVTVRRLLEMLGEKGG